MTRVRPTRRRVTTLLTPPLPAGIYTMPGRLHGCRCLVAYDGEGEFTFRCDEAAYASLRLWLSDRGVHLPEASPLGLLEQPA